MNPFEALIHKEVKFEELKSGSFESKKVKKNKNKISKLKPTNPKISTDDPIILSLIKLCTECMGDFQLSQKDINKTVEKVNNDSEGNWNWHQLG